MPWSVDSTFGQTGSPGHTAAPWLAPTRAAEVRTRRGTERHPQRPPWPRARACAEHDARQGGRAEWPCLLFCDSAAAVRDRIGSDRARIGRGRRRQACLSAPALAIGSNYASESHAGMFVWQDPFPNAPKAAVSIRPLLAARKAVGCSRCTAAVPLHDSVRVVDAGEPTLRR